MISVLEEKKRKKEESANLPPGLALFIPLGSDPLLLSSLGATLLLRVTSCLSNLRRRRRRRRDLRSDKAAVVRAHNPLFEGDELLLLLLPALKVSVDERLQLDQVFVLAFLLDVLQELDRRWTSLIYTNILLCF